MRRTARPEPSVPVNSLEIRLAGAPTPQYNQTGVGAGSTSNLNVVNIMASGTVSGSVGTFISLTVNSSAPKSMAFQSATGVTAILANSSWLSGPVASSALTSTAASIVAVNSSWQSGPVTSTAINGPHGLATPSTGKFTDLTVTGTMSFGTFTADLVAAILGYVTINSATGGVIRLAAVST